MRLFEITEISDDDEKKVYALNKQLNDLASVFNHIDHHTADDKKRYQEQKLDLITQVKAITNPQGKSLNTKDKADPVAHWERELERVTKVAKELEKTAPAKDQKVAPSDIEGGKKRHKYLHAVGEVTIAKRELKAAKSKAK